MRTGNCELRTPERAGLPKVGRVAPRAPGATSQAAPAFSRRCRVVDDATVCFRFAARAERRPLPTLGLLLLACFFLQTIPARAAEPTPLPHAHAHNDYEHARPLHDALARGFCSVEADIWLVDGRLLVAHDRTNTTPARTLQSLYLDPLRQRAQTNGGRIYSNGPSLTLLVDVKSDATNTWLALRKVLRDYEPLLTRFREDRTWTNAVTVIISGNRARALMEKDMNRLAACDGRLADLTNGATRTFIPLISDNWRTFSTWRGPGPLPPADARRLRDTVAQAHAQGRRIRFWGAPDTPEVWAAFRAAGVDLLNTDNLDELKNFLTAPERR